MPNLHSTSPVGCGEGGCLHAAQTVGRSGGGSEREHSGATERQGAGWSNMAHGMLQGGEVAPARKGVGRSSGLG